MTLAELLRELPPIGLDNLAFSRRLRSAFRRKSITFCTGRTELICAMKPGLVSCSEVISFMSCP